MIQSISFLSFALAVFCYAVSQLQVQSKLEKWGHFWIRHSWKFKYKTVHGDPVLAPRNWYYKLAGVMYKERFPLSATFLVAFTDGYHACQSLMFLFLSFGISQLSHINFFIVWPSLLVVFSLTYRMLQR